MSALLNIAARRAPAGFRRVATSATSQIRHFSSPIDRMKHMSQFNSTTIYENDGVDCTYTVLMSFFSLLRYLSLLRASAL